MIIELASKFILHWKDAHPYKRKRRLCFESHTNHRVTGKPESADLFLFLNCLSEHFGIVAILFLELYSEDPFRTSSKQRISSHES